MHKILHLADIHLDSAFLCPSESLRSTLSHELRNSFTRAIDCAIREHVVAVLITGDLFEAKNLTMATELFIREQFQRLNEAQIPVIYTAGQADAPEEVERQLRAPWPKNVLYITDTTPKVIELQDVDGAPIARLVAAYTGHTRDDLSGISFPQAKEGIPYIGVAHTRVLSAVGVRTGQDEEAPACEVRRLKSPGYLYWALGSVHHRQKLNGITNAWYPGNLVGRSAGEAGVKGGLLVSLQQEGQIGVEFKPFSSVRWFDIALQDLEHVSDLDDLFRFVEQAYDHQIDTSEPAAIQLIRLTLSGMCPLASELQSEARRAAIEEKLALHLDVEDVSMQLRDLTAPVDVDSFRSEPHLLSEVLRILESVPDRPDLLEELTPHPLAREMDDEERNTYLSRLLVTLDREAIVRLTRDESHAH